MLIYVVESGDTLSSIANEQGVTVEEIIEANGLREATNLVIGQSLLLPTGGDTKIGTIEINGYAYPFINRDTLARTLPSLSYISIFTHGVTKEGNLILLDDTEIIQEARSQNVAPLMVLSTLTEGGGFSSELASEILNNQMMRDVLIEEILAIMEEKQYYGLDVDFEYINPEDREAYIEFIKELTARLNPEGHPVFVALAPKTYSEQPGLLYEAHDYGAIGAIADGVLLMTYEWGYTYAHPCYR